MIKKSQIKIVLLICLIFLSTFYSLNYFISNKKLGATNYGTGNDYLFHYNASLGEQQLLDENHSLETYADYPPLAHLISRPFAVNPREFYVFYLFLIAFVIPFLLYLINKKPLIVLFYFLVTSLFYELEASVPLAEVFMWIILFLFILNKNFFVRVFLLLAALLTHSAGFWLISFAWILSVLFEEKENIFLVCAPLINKTEVLKQTFFESKMSLTSITNFFVFGFPLPFFLVSLKQLFNEKNYFFLSLIFLGLLTSFFNSRTLRLSQFFLLFGLTNYFYCSSKKMKFLILFGAFVVFVVELFVWYRAKLSGFNVVC